MTRLAGAAACLLLALPAAARDDLLYKASQADNEGQYLRAAELAIGVARDPEESTQRRYQGFCQAAASYGRLGAPRLAVATYHQALVALGRYDEHAADAWSRIADFYVSREEYGKACAHIEAALGELEIEKLPWPHRFRLLRHRANCLGRRGLLLPAAQLNEALAAQAADARERADALGAAAQLYAELHDFDKAEAALQRLDRAEIDDNAALAAATQAYDKVIQRFLGAGRRKEALALCSRALSRYGARERYSAQSLLRRLIDATADDEAAVMDVVAALEGQAAVAVASDEALDTLIPIAARTERGDDLVRACTHAMLARLLDESTARVCLTAIMDIRTRQGRHDDALAAARAAYGITGFESTSSAHFARAVGLVARALRARDGHLVSGNAFRAYQTYGPRGRDRKAGTADDLPNPFAGLKPAADPERDKLFQATLDRQPPTAAGWRARGWVYLLWSKPREALGAFKRAFALCPLDNTAMTRAAQDLALGLKARHGTPVCMNDFAQFQRYGPAGPDGRKGTRDDLEDPLAGL